MPSEFRIFLVEDDAGMRQALARLLGGCGFPVLHFDSAEALQDYLDNRPLRDLCSCLVCDIRLPGISGFELHHHLCERGDMPPVIFITAHDEPGLEARAQRGGPSYLRKPFEGRTLVALVKDRLGSSP